MKKSLKKILACSLAMSMTLSLSLTNAWAQEIDEKTKADNIAAIESPLVTTDSDKIYVSGDWEYYLDEHGNASIRCYRGKNTDIVIPATLDEYNVTSIQEWAFSAEDEITSVIIPDSVTTLGCGVFNGCTNLKSVTLSKNISTLPNTLFCECSSLESIEIPDGVVTIEQFVFAYCTNLTDINIPESVNKIDCYAFVNCTSLESITIPETVTEIEEKVFEGCSSLIANVVVNSYAHSYVIDNYIDFVVSFGECEKLTLDEEKNVSIESLGKVYAFTPSITGSYTFETFGNEDTCGILYDSTGYMLKEDDDNGNDDNFKIKYNLEADTTYYIGVKEYSGDEAEFVIKVSATPIYEYSVDLEDETAVITAYNGNDKDVVIPNKLDGYTVVEIGEYAFCSNKDIESVTIPDTVEMISRGAFEQCENMTSVLIPEGVEAIGDVAFNCCYNLSSITLPDSLCSAGDYVFYSTPYFSTLPDQVVIGNCLVKYKTNDTSVTISDDIYAICGGAFEESPNLTRIKIPASVGYIESTQFYEYDSITIIGVYGSKAHYATINSDLQFEPDEDSVLTCSLDSWCEADIYAAACYKLVVPETGDYIIDTSMGYDADIVIINADGTINTSDSGIVRAELEADTEYYFTICASGKLNYRIRKTPEYDIAIDTDKEEATFTCYYGEESSFTIPKEYEGYPVVKIGEAAFKYGNTLENIVIPEGVTSIDCDAFAGCNNLTSITIPGSVTYIDEDAFWSSEGMTIYCPPCSKAKEFACDCDINYVLYFDEIGSFNLGEKLQISANSEVANKAVNEAVIYSFTPDKDGKYLFASDGDCDTYGRIYDESGEVINCRYSADMDGNFKVYAKLYAGTKYYFGVGLYQMYQGDNFTVYVKTVSDCEFNGVEHIVGKIEGKEPTCTENGLTEGEICTVCNEVLKPQEIIEAKHKIEMVEEKKPTCTQDGYEAYFECSVCGDKFSDAEGKNSISKPVVITKTGHTYNKVVTKATTTKDGSIVNKCSCGDVSSTTKIYYPKTVTLSATSYTYSGTAKKPTVTVKNSAGNVITSSNYSVAYSKNTAIGTANVVITFKGNYTGTIKKTFKILPQKTTVTSVTNSATGMIVKWNKVSSAAGYKVYRSVNGKSYTLVKTITNNSTVSFADTAANTNGYKYTYAVKPYKVVSGATYMASSYTAKYGYRLTRPTIASAANSAAGKLIVKWNKNASASGYQVRIINGASDKVYTVSGAGTLSKTFTGLKKGATVKIYVRSYKKVGTVNYFSAYSAVKSAKIAK